MFVILRRSLARSRFVNSSSLCESNVVFSLPLLHFSTSDTAVTHFSHPEKSDSVLAFLKESGFSHAQLEKTLKCLRPTVSVYDFLVHNHHFSPISASQIATAVTRFRHAEKSDSVLAFLKESGFSHAQLEKTLKCRPQLLSADLEKNTKPKIKGFQDFGISAHDAAEIVAKDPWILRLSLHNAIIPSLTVLKNFLGSSDLAKILKLSGRFLSFKLNETLVPNIELLKKCGISVDQIISVMYASPWFLLCKPKKMKKFVDRAVKMGVRRDSKRFIHAVRVIGSQSDEIWDLKLRNFREMGFSDDDIAVAFRKSPTLFSLTKENLMLKLRTLQEVGFSDYDLVVAFRQSPVVFRLSEEKVKKAIKVLLRNGKYDLSCIVRFPGSLTYSVEKRFVPRMQVLELLEGRHLIQGWPCFSTFCMMKDKMFHKKYVAPFVDEIGDAYMAENATTGARTNGSKG